MRVLLLVVAVVAVVMRFLSADAPTPQPPLPPPELPYNGPVWLGGVRPGDSVERARNEGSPRFQFDTATAWLETDPVKVTGVSSSRLPLTGEHGFPLPGPGAPLAEVVRVFGKPEPCFGDAPQWSLRYPVDQGREQVTFWCDRNGVLSASLR